MLLEIENLHVNLIILHVIRSFIAASKVIGKVL